MRWPWSREAREERHLHAVCEMLFPGVHAIAKGCNFNREKTWLKIAKIVASHRVFSKYVVMGNTQAWVSTHVSRYMDERITWIDPEPPVDPEILDAEMRLLAELIEAR